MEIKLSKKYRWPAILFGTWGLYFTLLLSRLLYFDADGNLTAGHLNVWSDWSLHIGMAKIFAEKSPTDWFAYHLMYADGKMTYPFLANFIPGMLMRLGMPLVPAMLIPSIMTFVFLLLGIHKLFSYLMKSEAKSYLAITIFFLASGLGFINYLSEFISAPSWDMLFHPPHEYGRMDSVGWFAANFITGMFLPQRSFPLGVTLASWSLYWLFSATETLGLNTARGKRRLLLAGFATGILPISHMHSFIFIFVVAGAYCLLQFRNWKPLLYYVLPAGILSTRLYLTFVAGGIQNQNFMSFVPGFVAKNLFDWFGFWAKAWGLMVPFAISAFCLKVREWPTSTRVFFAGSILFFVVSNLVQFQPIQWDNSKLFLWSYFGFSGLASVLLYDFWKRKKFRIMYRSIATLVFISLTATGTIEVLRLQQIKRNSWWMIPRAEIELADRVREGTDPRARFLTEASHNHWVMFWAARPMLMGYTAWVLNFGFNYQPLERELPEMFRGTEITETLLRKHQVSYVVIGPGERRNFPVNDDYFKKRFPLAFSNLNYLVYDVRSVLGPVLAPPPR